MATGGTIVAIASPRGAGRRGVLRVSGPGAWAVVEATWSGEAPLPERGTRGFFPGRFDDGEGTQPLLLLWMPGPRSFTREDVAELHLPGSPPLLEAALARVLALDVRPAEPGEFTRRAFENGRIDLTRAEGILALIEARGEVERRSASALMLGGLADRLAPLRDGLDALRSLCEASLDFDEAETGHVPSAELTGEARRLLEELRAAARWEARRVARSDLPRVALVGAPNAGKSTLFNALVADAEALVSDLRGTTRDLLHGQWETPGGTVRLYDTAGLEQAPRGPDADAQRMARGLRHGSDLQLWVVDRARAADPALPEEAAGLAPGVPTLLVWSQADRGPAPATLPDLGGVEGELAGVAVVSAASGDGLARLAEAVAKRLTPERGEAAAGARPEREIGARHRAALERSAVALEGGLAAFVAGGPLDLFAEALREATGELDAISGRTTPEDLLDRIFAAFCLGK